MNVDFLPERIRAQRARRQHVVQRGYLLGITVAALIGLGYVNQGRLLWARAELATLGEQSANMTMQLCTLDRLRQQLSDLMIKGRIDSHLGSRVNATDVLRELGRVLPESMVLTNLDFEARPVPMKTHSTGRSRLGSDRPVEAAAQSGEKMINRVRVILGGLSPNNVDVANFIANLSASPLFEDVNMGYSKNTLFCDRSAKQFEASCYVVP